MFLHVIHVIDIQIKVLYYFTRLKIENLEPFDSGWYMCRAVNKAGQVNTTGFLEVKEGKSQNMF